MRRGRAMSFENFSLTVEDYIDDFVIRSGNGACSTCEFCFPHFDDKGNVNYDVCASVYYDKKIIDYSKVRDCWEIGFDEYCNRWEDYKKKYDFDKMLDDGYRLYLIHGWKPLILDTNSGMWSVKE